MSYFSIDRCANDQAFLGRVTACAAQEGAADPVSLTAQTLRWAVATATDVEAAYESALAADNPDPGGDATVVTDGMILANVQPNLPPA